MVDRVKTDIITDHWHRKIYVALDLQFPLASSAGLAFKRVKCTSIDKLS